MASQCIWSTIQTPSYGAYSLAGTVFFPFLQDQYRPLPTQLSGPLLLLFPESGGFLAPSVLAWCLFNISFVLLTCYLLREAVLNLWCKVLSLFLFFSFTLFIPLTVHTTANSYLVNLFLYVFVCSSHWNLSCMRVGTCLSCLPTWSSAWHRASYID